MEQEQQHQCAPRLWQQLHVHDAGMSLLRGLLGEKGILPARWFAWRLPEGSLAVNALAGACNSRVLCAQFHELLELFVTCFVNV